MSQEQERQKMDADRIHQEHAQKVAEERYTRNRALQKQREQFWKVGQPKKTVRRPMSS